MPQLETTSAWTLSLGVLDLFLALIVELLGLADAGRDRSTLIERHGHPRGEGRRLLLLDEIAEVEESLIIRLGA